MFWGIWILFWTVAIIILEVGWGVRLVNNLAVSIIIPIVGLAWGIYYIRQGIRKRNIQQLSKERNAEKHPNANGTKAKTTDEK